MNYIEVNGARYQIGKLSAMQQFHLGRRLGPALIMAGIGIDMLRKGMRPDMDDIIAIAQPILEVLSKMDDKEAEYIIFTALRAVSIQQGDKYAPLMTADGARLMFENIEMPDMMRLVGEVIKDNLGNFLKGLDGELTSSSSLVPSQQQPTKA